MKQNLIVAYPDGREDVYPITEGSSTLGSDAKCEFGIQAPGVEPRHIFFSSSDDAVFVVNLCDSETAWLNGVPLDERHLFEVGDQLNVGAVTIRLRRAAQEGEDLSVSAAGVAEVAKSARRDLRSGWRGYRKILEKIAPFISPAEAETAERLHFSAIRALARWLLAMVALAGMAWTFQIRHWFICGAVASYASSYVFLIATLILAARHRIRCVGRIFSLIAFLGLGGEPLNETWTNYFNTLSWGVVDIAVLCYLWGWLYDIGLGCIFAKRRRGFAWRYLLLLVSVGMLCWLFVQGQSYPGAAYCYWPLLGCAASYPIWARHICFRLDERQLDILFVLRLASFRDVRRWIARTWTVLATVTPLLLILGSLGARNRLVWKETDDNLVITETESGEKLAWYWSDRGRYMAKTDFDTSLIYQIPYDVLLAPAANDGDQAGRRPDAGAGDSEAGGENDALKEKCEEAEKAVWERSAAFRLNELCKRMLDQRGVDEANEDAVASFFGSDDWKNAVANFERHKDAVSLSAKGKDLCRKIAVVQLEATNAVAFAELKEALSPYRITASERNQFAELGNVRSTKTVFLEEVNNRETYGSREPKLYHAQIGVGIQPRSLQTSKYMSAAIGSVMIPSLVLLAIGGLLLWKRGGDSAVGFWLGIATASHVLGAFLATDYLQIESSMKYHLWHWAVESPWGGVVAGWLGMAFSAGRVFWVIALLAQSVLFVLLCWPRKSHAQEGRWQGWLIFIGKVAMTAVLTAMIGITAPFITPVASSEATDSMVGRFAAILSVGLLGWLLRRKRRFLTEAPDLGWEFFGGWLLLTMAISLPIVAGSGLDPLIRPEIWLAPITWMGERICLAGILSGIAAVAGGALFLRLLIRRNFLSVLTVNGLTFALFALIVPLISAICNPLVAELLRGSFLQSRQGERIVSIAIVVLVMHPIWNYLSRLSKRLAGRNIVQVESRVEATLENILEKPGEIDVRDEVFDRLEDLGLKKYALYVRTKADSFDLALKNRWPQLTADTFQISAFLRHYLGFNPHVVELDLLAHNESLFFQSFELCRIKERLHAACLLPICLGKSVRAALVTPLEADGSPILDSEVILENLNAIGLATIVSLNERTTDGHSIVDEDRE